ncbi:MAG: rhamnulokinase family protein [Coriobacteriales bacterium]|nr:rhamnulokinase family protein [Coriobacteriales bacterium]
MGACHVAIDIGASSGRHIVGQVVNGRMELTEVYRFENGLTRRNGHLCWDIDTLAENVIAGLAAAKEAGFEPETVGIDTWAVDFVLLDEHDERIGDCVGYRDARTDGVRDALELSGILSFGEHYARTGIQYQQFNTAYQLCALSREDRATLDTAHTLLMVPDYLGFVLTGAKAQEYTNASTTALVGAESCDWDWKLIDRLNLPRRIFQPISMPGESLGHVSPEIAERIGYKPEVVLVASHDTGSAWLAVPARDEQAVYFSSGTWSLVGVENRAPICSPESAMANFTNEGGYEQRYRYLKNIMGLWMIQNVRKEFGEITGTAPSWDELVEAAEAARAAGFRAVVDADDQEFLAPASMLTALREVCARSGQPVPETMGQYALTVYDSLAADYAHTVELLSALTGVAYISINIVGGGSNNGYLNQATADACGLPVFAGPTEGTALGNLMAQFIFAREYESLEEARAAIKKSFEIKEYLPR